MNAQWKPGDVAMVRLDSETEIRVMQTSDGFWRGTKGALYDLHLSARPLVLIDPEDREAVKRLVTLVMGIPQPFDIRTDDMQAALREFANPTPPKPDEPQGLGAVVERADGNRWVRGPKHWTNLDAPGRFLNWSDWSEMQELSPVVRVLSPGYTEDGA